MTQSISLEKVISLLGFSHEQVVSVSLHNPRQSEAQSVSGYSKLLVVLSRGGGRMKIANRRINGVLVSTTIIDESLFKKDCVQEELGGAAAHLLLIPYIPLLGGEFLRSMEASYFRHISMESLRNLILSYKLSSTFFIVTPEYILYDKLKRISTIYPLSRLHIKNLDRSSIEIVLEKLKKSLDTLVYEGYLKKNILGYSPTEKLVDRVLSEKTLINTSEDFEHIFKLYISTKQSSVLDFIRYVTLDPSTLMIPKIPDPEDYLYTITSLGPQPFPIRLTVEEFIKNLVGVDVGRVNVKRSGGILNATYTVEFYREGKLERIFVKKYLNWSDFKWVAAWLWALGVKNFSIMASTRMSNEIFFINKLAELGFNTAEVLHINWKDKILFQKYIEGENTIQYIKNRGLEKAGEAAEKLGRVLAELHLNDVTMGDCNPFSFIFTSNQEIYLTDLEQCSLKGLKPWDLTELILYTAHYLPANLVEEFAYIFSKAYLENGGDPGDLKESTEQKYTRLLSPLTPFWIQSRAIKGIQKILEEKGYR
jgi:tRNA A-37 threonylcarbamoyl transferase component Bud32